MKFLMYHYVRPADPALPYFRHLPLEHFEKQLAHFAAEYGFCSQADFLRAFETGTPAPGVVLTFDDGLRDHIQHVLPLLLERGLWGIFYVPSGPYRTEKLLDVHRIHMLLGRHGGRAIHEALTGIIVDEMLSHAHVEEFRTLTYVNQNNDDYTNLVKRILNYYISYEHREHVIDELMRRCLPDERSLVAQLYLSTDEIRRMQSGGMLIGSHSVSHQLMSRLSKEEQGAEIGESFDFLERVTGGLAVRSFCYPYGGFHSFTDETERLLQESGCLFAVNVEPRDVESRDLRNRPQALPRHDCNQFPWGSAEAGES